MICSRHLWSGAGSCICLDRGSGEGGLCPLLRAWYSRANLLYMTARECETLCQDARLGGFCHGRRTELYRSQGKIPVKAK